MINKYAVTFLLMNFGFALTVGIILGMLNVSFSPPNIIYAIAAALLVGSRFAKKENRLATDKEKSQLAKMSLLYTTVVGIILVLILSFFMPILAPLKSVFSSLNSTMIFVGFAAFLFVIYFYSIKFFFGLGAKNELKKKATSD